MNVSKKVKHIWWATKRCGTRSVSEIMKCYDFFNYETGLDVRQHPHTHAHGVPEEFSDYKIVVQVRNPYSRSLSLWHLERWKEIEGNLKIDMSFEDYINSGYFADRYEDHIIKYKPYYYIRYESLSQDILNLPFYDNSPEVAYNYNNSILNNAYRSEGVDRLEGELKRDYKDIRYADWRSYYTKDLADKVYEKCALQFELLNYQKDSWK